MHVFIIIFVCTSQSDFKRTFLACAAETLLIVTYCTVLFSLVDPLSVDYSGLTSNISPGITATLNSLCAEPLNHFFVGVLFGVQRVGGMDCRFMQSRTMLFIDSRIVFVPLDTNVVTIPTDQATDYEYCARVTLNEELCDGKHSKLQQIGDS